LIESRCCVAQIQIPPQFETAVTEFHVFDSAYKSYTDYVNDPERKNYVDKVLAYHAHTQVQV